MSKTKKRLIVALVCVNVALVASLVFVAAAPKAQAAGMLGGGTDYLVVTGKVSSSTEVVYVIDIARDAMAAWKFDKTNKKMQLVGARTLKDDFKR
jgi:hypothetical protein